MIRVAVVGAGHWGPNLVRNFVDPPRSEVAVVVDVDAARLARVAARFPGVPTATTFDAALAPGIDAVVVATPTSTHFPLARAALRAGKHVLVEKPLATSARDADELVALADATGLVLMVGHVFLFNAAVRRVKQSLERDELGRLLYVSMVRTNLGPIRTDVDAAWDLVAHDVSILRWWLGADPVSATAIGGSFINPGIDDVVFATLRFPGGVLANVHASWLSPRKARDVTVVGERRMLTFDDMNLNEPIRIYDKTVESPSTEVVDTFAAFRASVRDGDIVIPKVAGGEPLKTECDHFVACVAGRTRPLADGRLGAAVVRALEAISRSARARGAEVAVEPAP